jgi:selenocysteine-specific elongation factor
MSGLPSAPFPASRCDPQVLDLAIESLLTSRQIERNGVVYAQVGWSARVTDLDQQLCERIAAAMQEARWAPPGLEELAGALHEAPPRVEKMLCLLVERGVLVRLDERIVMHQTAIDAAKQVALGLFRKAPSFTTMDFRDALGVSRKYAVPLVDHLDKARFTVRSGNNRTPGVEAKKLLAAAQS